MSSPTSTDNFTQERPNKPMMKFWGPAANDDSIVRAHERHTAVCRPLAQDPPPRQSAYTPPSPGEPRSHVPTRPPPFLQISYSLHATPPRRLIC